MSGIQAVSSNGNKSYARIKNTGYTALAGLGVTTVIAFSNNKSIKKFHKPFGILTAAPSLLHLGVILHSKSEWKKKAAINGDEFLKTQQNEGVLDNEAS